MTRNTLVAQIRKKESFLCIGLDVDLEKIPPHLLRTEDPIFEFNKQIIKATKDLAVAYKPNTAFYEAYGLRGWQALEKTITYLNQNHPELFTIADAKRCDIGNTSMRYATAFFEKMAFDSITVAPYMGEDSIAPFLTFRDKFTILLVLTSNKSRSDFQNSETGKFRLFEQVLRKSLTWENAQQLMYVVGATQPEYFEHIRNIVPDHFLLVPGIGVQGGALEAVCKKGFNKDVGLLVNSSRSIIYAGKEVDFAQQARKKAMELQAQMQRLLQDS